MTLLKKRL